MAKIRLNSDEIHYINRFEELTGAKIRDCVSQDDALGFLVSSGSMGKAIGRAGSNIERVRKVFGKEIWLMEDHDNTTNFIKNLFEPIKVKRVRLVGEDKPTMAIVEVDRKDRRRILGANQKRLKIAKKLAQRYHRVQEISLKSD